MIRKYRTLENAEKDLWVMEPGADYWARVSRLFDSFFMNFINKMPPGIHRYATLEEAGKDREKWLLKD